MNITNMAQALEVLETSNVPEEPNVPETSDVPETSSIPDVTDFVMDPKKEYNMQITEAFEADIHALACINNSCNETTHTPAVYRALLSKTFIARLDGHPVGFIMCAELQTDEDFLKKYSKTSNGRMTYISIYAAGVLKSCRNTGLGGQLLATAIRRFKYNDIVIHLNKTSHPAMLRLCGKKMFKIIKTIPNYYEDTIDSKNPLDWTCVVMVKQGDKLKK